jgi:signal transduction histidine kinase
VGVTTGLDGSLARWEQLQRYLPYAGLAVGSLLTVLLRDPDWPPTALALGITALALTWVRALRSLPGPLFFAGWIVLATALVVCSPWYGFSVFVGYLFAVERLPGRWWTVGVAATAALVALCQIGGLPPLSPAGLAVWVALWLVNAGLAGGFTYYGKLTETQSDNRQRAIGELAEANERLEAALRENADLQAQLVASAREAGTQDERARLAREIHDTIAQGLAGVVAQLQAAKRAGPAERDRHLDTAAELARSSLAEARRSVQALRPEPLESARLPDALADVTARWSAVSGVPAAVTTTGTARVLHPEVEVALLRTGQEALANVGKHAGASRVGVTLSYMEDVVTLDVVDDGTGFDPGGLPGRTADGSGYGLSVMRERVARVAGRLEVESAPGEGTAVSATVPAIPA